MEQGNSLYIEITKDVFNHLEYTIMCTFQEPKKHQNKDMLLVKQLDQSKLEDNELKI